MTVKVDDPAKHARTLGGTTKVWRSFWMIAAFLAALVIVFLLVRPTFPKSRGSERRSHSFESPAELVRVSGPREILVKSGTRLAENLGVVTVEKKKVSYPLLTATGSVVARIRPGNEPLEERWQFANADAASAYADWLKSKSDIEFAEGQLQSTRDLTQAQVQRNEEVVARLRPLGKENSIPRKDVVAA
jgi:membrane fusion protein, heavy metal efflux system